MLELLIRGVSHVLVPLFFAGMVGATIVVAVTFVHDVVEFFEDDDLKSPSAKTKQP